MGTKLIKVYSEVILNMTRILDVFIAFLLTDMVMVLNTHLTLV